MMKRFYFLLCTSLLAACAQRSAMQSRYANAPMLPGPDVNPVVAIHSAPTESPPGAEKPSRPLPSVVLLNPAQKQVVEIKKLYEEAPALRVESDYTQLQRTIVLTLDKGAYRPANRFVNFRLTITPKNFEFTQYKAAETLYSTVDVEKFSLKQSREGTLKVTPSPFELGVSAGQELSEESDIKVRFENFTTYIDNGALTIFREAERGIDLAGNTLVKVVIDVPPSLFAAHVEEATVATNLEISDKGQLLPPSRAALTTQTFYLLKPVDLVADVRFDYIIRHVLTNAAEYAEHRQAVRFDTGVCKGPQIVVAAREVATPQWLITNNDGAIEVEDGGIFRPLTFTDPTEAAKLATWMMHYLAGEIGKRKLQTPKLPGMTNKLDNHAAYPQLTVVRANPPVPQKRSPVLDCTGHAMGSQARLQ